MRAACWVVAPVPPLPMPRAVPDQLALLTLLRVARLPRPWLVMLVTAPLSLLVAMAASLATSALARLLLVARLPRPRLLRVLVASVEPS